MTHQYKTININEDNENTSKCTRKPSPYVRRVLAGEASDRRLPHGMCSVVAATADVIDERVDDYNEEYVFMAAMDVVDVVEPRSLSEARRLPEWRLWEQAMKEELHTLESAGTWEKHDFILEETNVVGSKWVFKVKRDAAGKPI
ncbi:hypothetical protein ACEPAF_140 [Sanghuangporus sanghuang]